MIKNKKAAMEMSVGTIVTIVLLMAVLVLGLVLIRSIFSSSTNAIDQIDTAVQDQINKLFAEEGKKLVVYPTSRQLTLRKGDDPKGFAFSIRNDDIMPHTYRYNIGVDPDFDTSRCGPSFQKIHGDQWLLLNTGTQTLPEGSSMELPELVLFSVPDSAPPCTITYLLDLQRDQTPYLQTRVFVTIK